MLLHLAFGPKQCPTHGANMLPRTLIPKSELFGTFVLCLIIWIDWSKKTFPPPSYPGLILIALPCATQLG